MTALRGALLLGLLLGPALAHAEEVAAMLATAEHHYAELDYRGAAEDYERAARDARATNAQRILAWERVGISWLVLGQKGLAREAFDKLFEIDPAHRVADPSLSPRQHAFIEEIRAAHPPKPAPVVAPVVAPVTPPVAPPRRPVWKRWYLWTPIAIGVVGLGVGLGLGLGLHRDGPSGSLPPGVVSLGLRD